MRLLCIVLALTLTALAAGCGVAVEGGHRIYASQPDPGILYQPEFYETATPEEVKKAIGWRSLKNQSYTERKMYKSVGGGGGGVLAFPEWFKAADAVASIFIPYTGVNEGLPVYPLQVAAMYTPYPEVITVMLDAGAEPLPAVLYVVPQKNNEVGKVLLRRAVAANVPEKALLDVLVGALSGFAARGNREMVEFCLGLPGVDVNHRVAFRDSPLVAALTNDHHALATYLMERGAKLPEDSDAQNKLLRQALLSNNSEKFWWLVNSGLDCSQEVRSYGYGLMIAAYTGKVADEAVIRHLADTVPVDGLDGAMAVKAAYDIGNIDAVRRLLARGADGGHHELLHRALVAKNTEEFWKLVNLGLDPARGDYQGLNSLLRNAGRTKDEAIIRYLADRVPVDGRHGARALEAACKMKNADAVKRLLARGAMPEDADGQLEFLWHVLYNNIAEGFWMAVELGADCSQKGSRDQNGLLHAVHQGAANRFSGVDVDEGIILHLADTVPVDGENGFHAVRIACRLGNVDAVRRLLARGAAADRNDGSIWINEKSPHAAELRAMLQEKGFKVRGEIAL